MLHTERALAGRGASGRAAAPAALLGVVLGNGGCSRMTRSQAWAQLESSRSRGVPAARAAAATASSKLRAPPADASGGRNGRRRGAAVHQAAQKKRRRRVRVIEQPGANSSLGLSAPGAG